MARRHAVHAARTIGAAAGAAALFSVSPPLAVGVVAWVAVRRIASTRRSTAEVPPGDSPPAEEYPAAPSRVAAMAALENAGAQSSGYAAAASGLGWFVEHAEGEEDFRLLTGYLRFPNIVPIVVAARALIRRYGTRGLATVLHHAEFDDEVEDNVVFHLICELHDLHLVEDFPVRDLLVALRDGGEQPRLSPFIDHLLSEHNLSDGSRGALAHLRGGAAARP